MKKISVFPVFLFLLSILTIISLNSCSLNETEQALVGLWRMDVSGSEDEPDPGVNIYYDFQENGEVILTLFTAGLESYGKALIPTHFDYKATVNTITMKGLYGMMTMEYDIVSGPVDGAMTIVLTAVDISLLPDDINKNLELDVSISLIKILDYSEKSVFEKALKEAAEYE